MRKYNITKDCEDFYKVQASDEYGFRTTVYERTKESASNYLLNWFESADERKKSNNIMNKAIKEMMEIDRKARITSENYDALD